MPGPFIDPVIHGYILETTLRPDPVLDALRRETATMPRGMMQIDPEQGQFMGLLAKLCGARRALEVGVFTGYSSICVARALPEGGRLVACDISEEYTNVARRYWADAGVADRIDLRLGPAEETLEALVAAEGAGSFDLAFIDADKEGYPRYYELCLTLLRPGGLLLVDNALWHGHVADAADTSATTAVIREVNATAGTDERVDVALLPVGDGLLMALKR